MEIIRTWLNGPRQYEQGIELYRQFGHNQTLKKILATEGWSAFKETKLVQALEQLLQSSIKIEKELPAGTTIYTRHKGWPLHPIEDPILLALHERWKPLYSEMMHAQSRAYEVALIAEQTSNPTKKLEACQLIHHIMDLDEQIDDIYGQRDHYLIHQQLPAEPLPEIIGDPVRWATELKNAERYVRRYNNLLKKNPSNEKWASKWKHFTEQIAHYKKLLKLD